MSASNPETTEAKIEEIAIALWHRFAPGHHLEWEDEMYKAEYRLAAQVAWEMAHAR